MAYAFDTQWNFPAHTKAQQVAATFGYQRPAVITVDVAHWWNLPYLAGTYDFTNNFFMGQPPTGSSAHYVVTHDRVSCGVAEADASHANGNAWANATTVTWELDPRLENREQVIETFCDAVSDAWVNRGLSEPGTLRWHNEFYATMCPGDFQPLIPYMQVRANELFWAKKNQPTTPTTGGFVESEAVKTVIESTDLENIMAIFATAEEFTAAIAKGVEEGNRSLVNLLTPGETGKKHAGVIFAQLNNIADSLKTVADSVTPGEAGKKHAGAIYSEVLEIKRGVETTGHGKGDEGESK